ncbi:MAG: hypothetical protein H7Z14_07430 [Anaerolineae bacterium]|nr:hypothetical protein [Phycisphaerae bacterium]
MRSHLTTLVMLLAVLAGVGCKIVGDESSVESTKGETRVDVNALPLNVTAAVKGVMPTGTITAAEKTMYKNKLVYSVDVRDGEKEYDIVVTPDGQILSNKLDASAKNP